MHGDEEAESPLGVDGESDGLDEELVTADGALPEQAPEESADTRGPASYRQLFEVELHKLPREERIPLARGCSGATLYALCFDPDPGVILSGVLENPRAGLEHARLVAAHHRTGQGLQGLASRTELLRDLQVQRHLLRNPQAGEALLRKFLAGKALQPLFQLMMGHELTERARRMCTTSFKERFQRSSPSERVGIIFTTEGRCLRFLIGAPIDGRTAAMICERSILPVTLVQNLARWPATPPVVLRHLARQSTIRHNPGVRRLILQHPNCPREVKRG